jgi:hypothetical protein
MKTEWEEIRRYLKDLHMNEWTDIHHTPANKGVDAQPDLVGRKRLHDQHVEIKTYGERVKNE